MILYFYDGVRVHASFGGLTEKLAGQTVSVWQIDFRLSTKCLRMQTNLCGVAWGSGEWA